MSKCLIFLYNIITLNIIDSARILGVFPTPSISHQVVFRVLTQELARRGHEVVVITTDPAYSNGLAPDNLREIDTHNISYHFLRNVIPDVFVPYGIGRELECSLMLKELQRLNRIIEIQAMSQPVQEFIREKKEFDIVLIEPFLRSAIVFSKLYKAPIILVSSMGATIENYKAVGAPIQPSLYPTARFQRLYNLSTWDELRQYYNYMKHAFLEQTYEHVQGKLLPQIFGDFEESISEMYNNVEVLLLNVHPVWVDSRPVPPGVVLMGGLHQNFPKELPQDLKSYLDSSNNGVVYVSFGSNIHPYLFPPERLNVITEALSELNYDILFKWSDEKLLGIAKNIKISKWLPQSDLLRHPNVKAFITQGGLQSTDEAITAGVPLICIPMFGDQWYNAEKYVHMKIGLKLDFVTFTKAQLKNAVETVILEERYRENIEKLRQRMYDRPKSSLEYAVWWVEYVLRHGGAKHLRAPAANMSWSEYYELELVLILTCLFISAIVCLFIILKKWYKIYFGRDDHRAA